MSKMTTEEGKVAAVSRPDPFDRAKRLLLLACGAMAGGLAIAGSVDRSTGGVLILIGWLIGIAALHRLGRTGSDRAAPPKAVGARDRDEPN